MMSLDEISWHEVKVYQVLRSNPDTWMSNRDIANAIGNIADRTVRAHTRKLVRFKLVDEARVFPGHKYRYSKQGDPSYSQRLDHAAAVFRFEPLSP